MQRRIAIGLVSLLMVASATDAFALRGGGGVYRGPMGGVGVRGPGGGGAYRGPGGGGAVRGPGGSAVAVGAGGGAAVRGPGGNVAVGNVYGGAYRGPGYGAVAAGVAAGAAVGAAASYYPQPYYQTSCDPAYPETCPY